MLLPEQLEQYRKDGFVVVEDFFSSDQIQLAVDDAELWQTEFLEKMDPEKRKWYADGDAAQGQYLRKIDNPIFLRKPFQRLASGLTNAVSQILGDESVCFFSQFFVKPPEGGGPKPTHQDNFYFGPKDPDSMLTAWIALDNATVENGCLHYWKGSHRQGLVEHQAPEDQPYNLQVPNDKISDEYPKVSAEVTRGGVSFHHGFTFHCSSSNLSTRFRRAVAVHCMRKDAVMTNPAMEYDSADFVPLTASGVV